MSTDTSKFDININAFATNGMNQDSITYQFSLEMDNINNQFLQNENETSIDYYWKSLKII